MFCRYEQYGRRPARRRVQSRRYRNLRCQTAISGHPSSSAKLRGFYSVYGCYSWETAWGIRTFPWTFPPRTYPPDIPPHGQFPLPFYMVEDISPFHHHHAPIYNIQRSTVNVYKLIAVRLGIWVSVSFIKVPRLMGRLGSGFTSSVGYG